MTLWGLGYLASLIVSILGLGAIDKKHRLALFSNPVATTISIFVSVFVFLAWDLAGIALGIFFIGPATFVTGIELAPNLPLEEFFFLILLCYSALVSYRVIERWRK